MARFVFTQIKMIRTPLSPLLEKTLIVCCARLENFSLSSHITYLLTLFPYQDEDVIVGTESSNIYIQNIEEGLLVGLATRFTAAVTCIAFNKDRSRLLAGSR